MATISFSVSSEDEGTIRKIHTRAMNICPTLDRLSLDMDLHAAQANNGPFKIERLLGFDDFNFVHDVAGIIRHINRETGKLGDCFEPRCGRR